jgi:hypothetical protein
MIHNKKDIETTEYCLESLEVRIRSLSVELNEFYESGTIAQNEDLIKKSQELDSYIVVYLKELRSRNIINLKK